MLETVHSALIRLFNKSRMMAFSVSFVGAIVVSSSNSNDGNNDDDDDFFFFFFFFVRSPAISLGFTTFG